MHPRTFCDFEAVWDPRKNAINMEKHKIDFEDVVPLFNGYPVVCRSARDGSGGERRESVVGRIKGLFVFVVYTIRKGQIRIISARKARDYERKVYQEIARKNGLESFEGNEG